MPAAQVIYHVFPIENGWDVMIEGEAPVALASFPTRREAIAWCRSEAVRHPYDELQVHGDDAIAEVPWWELEAGDDEEEDEDWNQDQWSPVQP